MSLIKEVQNQIVSTLLNQGVKVIFSNLEEEYGYYIEEENLILVSSLVEDPVDILQTIAHEAVHYLQVTKGLLIGDNSPNHWNPKLDNPKLLEDIVKAQYDPDEWKYELPAWSLQYAPRKVLELLNS